MRINIYSQELTKEVELVSKVADTGIMYCGIRLYLASPNILHHTADDDDRSAITFWIPNAESFTQDDLAQVFDRMAGLAIAAPQPQYTHRCGDGGSICAGRSEDCNHTACTKTTTDR